MLGFFFCVVTESSFYVDLGSDYFNCLSYQGIYFCYCCILVYCLSYSVIYVNNVFYYRLINLGSDYLRNFWNDHSNYIYPESLNRNDFYNNLRNYFCLNSILSSYCDINGFDYLICCIYFVKIFGKFFCLEIVRENYFGKVIVVYSYLIIWKWFSGTFITMNIFVW